MTDIKEIARLYIEAGWAVVPLVKGEKRADTKWQGRTYSPDDFPQDAGIAGKCGEPSGWRVDIDLDHPLAIEIAPMFLPDTQLIHGRPGKPNSHWWFICEGIKTRQFTGPKQADGSKEMYVEIRSTGGYTALPPSGHPSGDVLAWAIERAPMRLDQAELIAAVNYVAVATILAVYWPGTGARHAFIGHLTGFLLKGGVPAMVIPRIVVAAATAARDADVRDRENFCRTTISKWNADKDAKLTGGPMLAEVIGKDVVARLRSWLGVADDDAIEEMNTKHFWVRVGRDDVIGREDTRDGVVCFQRPQALRTEYANVKVKTGEKVNKKDGTSVDQFKNVFDAWLEHPARRSYREVVFQPPPHRVDPRDYNLWKGFALTPKQGDCSLFLRHIEDVICDGDTEIFDYLLNLLAKLIQEPGTPAEVAVVLRGEQGTGKGRFVRTLIDIFGRHAIQLDNVKHLVGGFNAAISGKVLVFADEAFWAGDKREVGALKRLITEPTLAIERKGIDVISENNYVHLFMATNEEWAIPAGMNERRFLALKVSSRYMQDHTYFSELNRELSEGGTAAFLWLMLSYPLDHAKVRQVPRTRELRTQQAMSLSPEMSWWHDCLHDARIGSIVWTATWVPTTMIFQAYTEWAETRRARVLSHVEFGRRLGAFLSALESKVRKINGENTRCLQLRSLQDARAYFDSKMATKTDWPSDTPPTQQSLPDTKTPF